MNIMNALQDEGGVAAIARELGVDEGTAHSGISALLPAVMGGMQNQAAAHPQGLGGLMDILAGLGGGGLLGQVTAPEPTDPSAGNDVLGQIFGSRDTSRAVTSDAARRTGLSPDLLKRMLPLVAMLAAGYFSKQAGRGVLGGMLGGDSAGEPSGGGLGGMLGGLLVGGGGNALNDILGKLER
jgi:hypothetical protein